MSFFFALMSMKCPFSLLFIFLVCLFVVYFARYMNWYTNLLLGAVCLKNLFSTLNSKIVCIFDVEMYATEGFTSFLSHPFHYIVCLFIGESIPQLLRDINVQLMIFNSCYIVLVSDGSSALCVCAHAYVCVSSCLLCVFLIWVMLVWDTLLLVYSWV